MIEICSPRVKDTESEILARVYQVILNWPNPEESETADPLYLDWEQEPAVQTTEARDELEPASN